MNNILEELWYGNIRPFENFISETDKHRELLREMGKAREELEKKLCPSLNELLMNYDRTLEELNAFCEKEAFAYGFRLAKEIMKDERAVL